MAAVAETKVVLSPIASPLAGKKLTKHCFKLIKKAAKAKMIRRGVKEVVKSIRKREKGIVVLAGDVSPVDVIAHLPVLCEEQEIPYVFVSSKNELGASALSKRPTSCIHVVPGSDFSEKSLFDKTRAEMATLKPVYPTLS